MGSLTVGPRDHARLWFESLEDRSVPSAGAFVRPAAPEGVDPDYGARTAAVRLTGCVATYLERGAQTDGVRHEPEEVTIINRTWHTVKFTLSNGPYLGTFVL